jgi:hypothetical protein
MAVMASRAQDVLKVMAGKDVTAPMLNAAYAVHLGRALTAPIIVVEGTLSVAGEVAQDHGWVMIGPGWLTWRCFRAPMPRCAAAPRHPCAARLRAGQGPVLRSLAPHRAARPGL